MHCVTHSQLCHSLGILITQEDLHSSSAAAWATFCPFRYLPSLPALPPPSEQSTPTTASTPPPSSPHSKAADVHVALSPSLPPFCRACSINPTGKQPAASPSPTYPEAAATAWLTPVAYGMPQQLPLLSAKL